MIRCKAELHSNVSEIQSNNLIKNIKDKDVSLKKKMPCFMSCN